MIPSYTFFTDERNKHDKKIGKAFRQYLSSIENLAPKQLVGRLKKTADPVRAVIGICESNKKKRDIFLSGNSCKLGVRGNYE